MTEVEGYLLQQWQVRHLHSSQKQWHTTTEACKQCDSSVNFDDVESNYSWTKVRFQQKARIVAHITRLCLSSRRNVLGRLATEPWYKRLDDLELDSPGPPSQAQQRHLITTTQGEFRDFKHEHLKSEKGESVLTEQVRSTLSKPSSQRSARHIPEIICCIKSLSKTFRNYPLSFQRPIVQRAWYECYQGNRVIMMEGDTSNGIYFILSGTVLEKVPGKRQASDIIAGSVLGENDLICGRRRQSTVLTRSTTEVLYLHRLDYKSIFEMADDLNDLSLLDVAKQHTVFQHFPTQKLEESPEMWTIVKYKYGRVIATDSNSLEWVYVINSGEARVLKYLNPGHMNLRERRKTTRAAIEAESPYHKTREILNFISERDHITTAYKADKYHPTTRLIKSAPPLTELKKERVGLQRAKITLSCDSNRPTKALPMINSRLSFICTPKGKSSKSINTEKRVPEKKLDTKHDSTEKERILPLVKIDEVSDEESKVKEDKMERIEEEVSLDEQQGFGGDSVSFQKDSDSRNLSTESLKNKSLRNKPKQRCTSTELIARQKKRFNIPLKGFNSVTTLRQPEVETSRHKLPAFVQVEVLGQGQIFGLRACLEPEERGPSVSLVSADCEVLQINKKFFMTHCDEALIAIIKHKAKPFPSDEELIDRLDISLRWEEYKQKLLRDFIHQRWNHRR
ncbi:hypothetical protein Bpfe_009862 [Biomphalaria pfeifferi]|uniref:Cyclic nucleotide-binding domain-containing protein n=1 Tax=Biomphalaria pfeifferi TaxID=112525 RepID=A0AAD8BTR4_BIOPF|nr:hypothetical protein Bpfe_009862 [Biomphalaria pfeifferi]